MSLTVSFQHVVEGAKSESGTMVAACPHDVILGCIVGRHGQTSFLFLQEDVVDDLKGSFIGADVVECENGVDDLSPLMVVLW